MNATTANQITVEWHERTSNLETLVQDFNDRIQMPPASQRLSDPLNDIVERIYPLIQSELKRLEELSEIITTKQDELTTKTWCMGPVSISENIRDLTIINGIAKVCELAGFSLAVFHAKDSYAQWIGFSVFVVAGTFDAVATVYEAKLHLERAEASDLAKINRDGIEHAKIFRNFLQKLKQVKEKEQQKREAYQSREESPLMHRSTFHLNISDHDDLDESIGDCLREYEELPKNYRKPEIQCFIISQLIQGLPKTHPLRIGLDRLKPLNPGENVSELANKPLAVRYLPDSPGKQRSHSSEDQTNEAGWGAEELKRSESIETGFIEKSELDPKKIAEEYKREVADYQLDVMSRFQLTRSIPYFITDNGWKVSPKEGLTKIESSSQETEPREIPELNNKPNEFKENSSPPNDRFTLIPLAEEMV